MIWIKKTKQIFSLNLFYIFFGFSLLSLFITIMILNKVFNLKDSSDVAIFALFTFLCWVIAMTILISIKCPFCKYRLFLKELKTLTWLYDWHYLCNELENCPNCGK